MESLNNGEDTAQLDNSPNETPVLGWIPSNRVVGQMGSMETPK